MQVYDDQKTEADNDELRKITGISSDEEKKIDENAVHDGSSAEKTESGGLYRGDEGPGKTFNRRVTKKQGIIGGIIGLVMAGAIGVTSFFSGPLQLIHYGQLLQRFHFTSNSQSSDSRVGRMIEYFRTGADPSKRNVNYLMEKVSQKYISNLSAKGVELNFDLSEDVSSRRLQAVIIDTNTAVGSDSFNSLSNEGFEGVELADGKFRFEVAGRTDRFKRSTLRSLVNSLKVDGKAGPMMSRILIKRAGIDMHPLRNWKWDKKEEWRVARAEKKKEKSDYVKDGDTGRGVRFTGETATDEAGNPLGSTDDLAEDANDIFKEVAGPDADPSNPQTRINVTKRLAGGAAAAVVAAALCVVNDVGDSIPEYQQANVILPAMRSGMHAITVASQIKSGQDVNIDELRLLHEDLYDETTGSSAFAAASIQAENGQAITGPDAPDEIKLKDGKANWLFDTINAIPGIDTACSITDSIVAAIPVVGGAAEWTSAKIAEITGLDKLMNAVVGFFAGEVVDTYATGALKGNIDNYGAFFAANDAAIAAGAGPVSTAQALELKNEAERGRRYAFTKRSLLDRVFNVYDSQSLIGSAVIQSSSFGSFSSLSENVSALPVNFFSYFGSGIARLLPSVDAQSASYDYGVPKFAFSEEELSNESVANPYENAEKVETCLAQANCIYSQYVECSNTTIDINTGEVSTGPSVNVGELVEDSDCFDGSQESLEYRMYLQDTMVAKSMACYEGIDELACSEIGFGNEAIGNNNGENSVSTPNAGASGQHIPDCSVNGGNAKIACVAIDTMLGIPYRNAYSVRPGCRAMPSAANDSNPAQLDCSAFTAMAVYRAFGTFAPRTSTSYLTSPLFEVVGDTRSGNLGDIRDIQPGDLIGRGSVASGSGGNGHIGIVVSYDRATQTLVTVETDSCTTNSRIVTNKGLAADGNGTYQWAVRYIGPKDSSQ